MATIPTSTTTPIKSTFLSSFTKSAKAVTNEAEVIIEDVEKEIEYSADKAINNIKSEAAKLDALIEAKESQIASHNKHILNIQTVAQAGVTNLQSLIVGLQSDVEKATALKTKITAALS